MAALLSLGLFLWWLREKKRREAWQKEAERLGCSLEPVNEGFPCEHGDFKLFTADTVRSRDELVRHDFLDAQFGACDFSFEEGNILSNQRVIHNNTGTAR